MFKAGTIAGNERPDYTESSYASTTCFQDENVHPLRTEVIPFLHLNLSHSEMSYHTSYHPKLGRIQGIERSDAVYQYLGIQYATLKDRFSRGELLVQPASGYTGHSDVLLDATKLGYRHYS